MYALHLQFYQLYKAVDNPARIHPLPIYPLIMLHTSQTFMNSCKCMNMQNTPAQQGTSISAQSVLEGEDVPLLYDEENCGATFYRQHRELPTINMNP